MGTETGTNQPPTPPPPPTETTSALQRNEYYDENGGQQACQHAILPSTYFPGISGRTMDRDRDRKWKKAGRRVKKDE